MDEIKGKLEQLDEAAEAAARIARAVARYEIVTVLAWVAETVRQIDPSATHMRFCDNCDGESNPFIELLLPDGSRSDAPMDEDTEWDISRRFDFDVMRRVASAGHVDSMELVQVSRRTQEVTVDLRVAANETFPLVQVATLTDPEAPVTAEVFLAGEQIEAELFSVDAGAGWSWEDWTDRRDELLESSHGELRAMLTRWLADPPGGREVIGRTGDWMAVERPQP